MLNHICGVLQVFTAIIQNENVESVVQTLLASSTVRRPRSEVGIVVL